MRPIFSKNEIKTKGNTLDKHTSCDNIIMFIKTQNINNVNKIEVNLMLNMQECTVLESLIKNSYTNQRSLVDKTNYSLGMINKILKSLNNLGYLDDKMNPTIKAFDLYNSKKPKNAIVLAAGYGMRMVPINTEVPKGLLEVNHEPLIERIIKQLHDVGVYEIYVVVGFLKEQYEYLIDDFGVELVVNKDYATKNNLHSLKLVSDKLSNTYIIPCDVWCKHNEFSSHEMYSWYMVSDITDTDGVVRVNRNRNIVKTNNKCEGNKMVGICYLDSNDSSSIRNKLIELSNNKIYDDEFWEEILYKDKNMIPKAKVVLSTDVVEINTYEQLRELDGDSNHLKTDTMNVICEALQANAEEIINITTLKKGMTNRSFLFNYKNKKYIMRIPGEGTDNLINREEEAEVYDVIGGKEICDDIIYINSNTGYKITEYLENARVCDANNYDDIKKCMMKLRQLHELELAVAHEFDIFKQIDFYESLWNGEKSIYRDYLKTKENVLSLKSYIDNHVNKKVLTHIDAVPDNFLFINKNGVEEIRLIDWEYAGMQDPHVDIAMFCIYSLYNKEQIDNLIDLYFVEGCSKENRLKIYCYVAACGLLWSNWCEYKRSLGVDFGDYSLRQYRYAKDYYKIFKEELIK